MADSTELDPENSYLPYPSAESSSRGYSEEQSKRLGAADMFEPGGSTKSFLYFTRKQVLLLGGMKFPGLIADAFRQSKGLVLTTLVVELIGIVVLSYGVWEESSWPGYVIGLGAGFLVVIDWIGAIAHHFKYKGQICKRENELLQVFPQMRMAADRKLPYKNYADKVNAEMQWGWKIISMIGIALILAVMLVKIVLLPAHVPQIWPPSIRWGVLGISAITYVWIFWVHLAHTGYYVAHLIYKHKVNADRKRFIKKPEDYWKQTDHVEFDLAEFPTLLRQTKHSTFADLVGPDQNKVNAYIEEGLTMDFGEVKGVRPYFEIRKAAPADPNSRRYIIQSLGMLYDTELDLMARSQPNPLAEAAVALWGHYLQIRYVNAASDN